MRMKLLCVAIGALLVAAGGPVFAHHSFAAEFDANRPVKLEGTVTKMDWINPHSWIDPVHLHGHEDGLDQSTNAD